MSVLRGEVKHIVDEKHIEWKIVDFLTLKESTCHSPSFTFANASWHLIMHPDGCWQAKDGFISVFLEKDSETPCTVTYTFSIKNADGLFVGTTRYTRNFDTHGWGDYDFFQKAHLSESKSEFLPSDALTIICHLKLPLQETDDALELLGISTSCESYRQMTLDGLFAENHFLVNNKKFPVHKAVFQDYPSFLERMFDSTIYLEDCNLKAFGVLLIFLYTGELENSTAGILPSVYELADKYGLKDLKQLCVNSVKSSLSIDNISDAFHLAVLSDDTNLLARSVDFFARNTEKILITEAWHNFNKENPIIANQLLLKSIEKRPYPKEMVTNDFREMVYKKMIALALHPENK